VKLNVVLAEAPARVVDVMGQVFINLLKHQKYAVNVKGSGFVKLVMGKVNTYHSNKFFSGKNKKSRKNVNFR
jgi:hypothetical protein